MGYVHGTKWSDELIKEKILEVVKNTELNRMPSRNEIRNYYMDDKLTNAISKRKGYEWFARELGLSMKESDTFFGKRQEAIAMEELVSYGYEVRKMPQNFPYDLLVNDAIKIDVKAAKLFRGTRGNFYSYNIEKPFCTCDIYILYLLNDDRSTKDVLILPSKLISTQTQISVGENTSKYYKYSNRWDYIAHYNDFLEDIS